MTDSISMTDSWKSLEGVTLGERFQLQNLLFENGESACFLARLADGSRPAGWLRLLLADGSTDVRQLQLWQTAAGLNHPNLLEVWETGRCERGATSMVYLLTEPADDNLATVLPERPLDQGEAREALLSAAKALKYLHSMALVHGNVGPKSILAVGDHVKLSSDTIAPSTENGDGLSAADDLRALGDCVHAMFTQKSDTDLEHLSIIPQPFRDIVRGCHGVNPDERWTAQRIVTTLDPPPTPITPAVESRAPERVPPPPPQTPRKRIPAWVFAVAGFGALFLVLLVARKSEPASPPPAQPAIAGKVNPAEPASPAPALPATVAKVDRTEPASPPPALPAGSKVTHAPKPSPFQPLPSPLGPKIGEASRQAPSKTTDASSQRSVWRVVSYTYSKAEDATRMVGNINRKWPDLRAEQYSPNEGGPPYYVALGGRMSRTEALRVQQQAIAAGLPPDTFIRNFKK